MRLTRRGRFVVGITWIVGAWTVAWYLPEFWWMRM